MTVIADKLCEIARRAYGRGLVSGTEGNLSCRLDEQRVLCTPTGLCKGRLTRDDLCVADLTGQQISGPRPRTSEIALHLEIYRADPRVRAVVHTHPPYATTLAVLGETVPAGILPEGEVFLGQVPFVPYETPGTAAFAAAVRPHVQGHVAAILQNHGTVTWGPDLETAYTLTETLEAVCRVVFQARQLGQLRPIPADRLAELAEVRARWRATTGIG